MPSLSRTVSHESAPVSRDSLDTMSEAYFPDLSAVSVVSSSDSIPLPLNSRSNSHALLSSSSKSSNASRKARSSGSGVVEAFADRASMSMPPPISKIPAGRKTSQTEESLAFGSEDVDKTPSLRGTGRQPSSCTPLTLPDSALRPQASGDFPNEAEHNRLSFSSSVSLGSAVHSGTQSTTSSNAGSLKGPVLDPTPTSLVPTSLSPSMGSTKFDASSIPTTATDPVSVTTASHAHQKGALSPKPSTAHGSSNAAAKHLDSWSTTSRPVPQTRRSRSRTQRRPSGSTAASSASPSNTDRGLHGKTTSMGKIGVCALDVKARSKPSRNILTRLQNNGEFEVIVFGDKVILDEDVENWPLCDYLISFFSDGFPLDKAIAYAQLRKPFCVNDLPMQKVLWDRRICLRILDCLGVPTPKRLEVNRDGGPTLESADLAHHVKHMTGVQLEGGTGGTGGGLRVAHSVEMIDDSDTLLVDGLTLKKPFVEKPVNGDDHNVRIYFPKSHEGGGGRRLFRKIGNKSSEWDKGLIIPRAVTESSSSYIYEEFLSVDNSEDIKAYTVGRDFCHAETRKSPVVDGLVRRNTHGKEIRYITSLTADEATMATRIADGFGQRICGFDLLRVSGRSYVIDVNGWSFVKDNNEYYDKCSTILRQMFLNEKQRRSGAKSSPGNGSELLPEAMSPVSHRSTFKDLFKSPSLTKLRGAHGRVHGAASPDLSASSTPLTSPPSLDQRQSYKLPASIVATKENPILAIRNPMSDLVSMQGSASADQLPSSIVPPPASKHSWKLKGMVAVIRHADRTPKQKFKFTFHTQPFVDLLRGHQEEVLLKGEAALNSVLDAVKIAMKQGIEDREKLALLRTSLARKGAWTGTKVQIRPMFRKKIPEEMTSNDRSQYETSGAEKLMVNTEEQPIERTPTRSDSLAGITLSRFSAAENDLILDKLQLIIKWGGEPTHSARYQSQDLGENMRNDLLLMNREALGDVRVFTSSERRVSTSAQIWAASFLDQKDVPEDLISVRKDLLDDSNAAKDVMDKVKKKLKHLLREGYAPPPEFAWPANMPEPSKVVRQVTELMKFHRQVMRSNFNKLGNSAAASLSAMNETGKTNGSSAVDAASSLVQAQAVASIQARWCCGEDAELFKERWEKLFSEFLDPDKVDPGKISELYDTMKFDALHNRQFLEWVFRPSANFSVEDVMGGKSVVDSPIAEGGVVQSSNPEPKPDDEKPVEKGSSVNLAQRMGFRRKSVMTSVPQATASMQEAQESYFKLYSGSGQSTAKRDAKLDQLRELYRLAKILFDFVGPQEYGIEDSEKLEIGLLTSLPLLKEIVKDLEEVQASEDAKSFIYFTKESHIYTLLNCILEGGIKTKIARNAIPELDYLSQIVFELYEAEDKDADSFAYSIRITITPGCHTFDPLDVQLDSKHSIGCAPRRSLTAHGDWKEVIETLRAKFYTVKLPKSFLAVNLSELHAEEAEKDEQARQGHGETNLIG
ncbi:hypothetical protein MMC13_005684 [Lambiella insularis]|nr:hypothetical protein [Lambiella insularis]